MKKSIKKISNIVTQITVGEPDFPGVSPPNMWLVAGFDRCALIDTAYGNVDEIDAFIEAWNSAGSLPLSDVILTHRHRDHIGGIRSIRDISGAKILCAPEEHSSIVKEIGDVFINQVTDGTKLHLGGVTLEILLTPGHTFGSLCVLLDEESLIFTGDTILGGSTTVISPYHGDMSDYIDSLRKIKSKNPKNLAPGHGELITDASKRIDAYIKHRIYRESTIVKALDEGIIDIEGLFIKLYPKLDSRLHQTAQDQILSHLNKLVSEGRVQAKNDGTYGLME